MALRILGVHWEYTARLQGHVHEGPMIFVREYETLHRWLLTAVFYKRSLSRYCVSWAALSAPSAH
eukprot:2235449-Amphidinium_carterae.1